jgi:hypothetical protein
MVFDTNTKTVSREPVIERWIFGPTHFEKAKHDSHFERHTFDSENVTSSSLFSISK